MGKPVIDQFSQHLLNSCYNLGKGSAHASCKGPDSMDFRLCRPHILCPKNRQCSMLSQWEAAAVSTEMSGCGCAPITELHLALAVGETRQPCPGVSGFITPERQRPESKELWQPHCTALMGLTRTDREVATSVSGANTILEREAVKNWKTTKNLKKWKKKVERKTKNKKQKFHALQIGVVHKTPTNVAGDMKIPYILQIRFLKIPVKSQMAYKWVKE